MIIMTYIASLLQPFVHLKDSKVRGTKVRCVSPVVKERNMIDFKDR